MKGACLWLLVTVVIAGCEDLPLPFESTAPPSAAATNQVDQDLRDALDGTFACFTAVRTPGEWKYRYGRRTLNFPSEVAAQALGQRIKLQVRSRSGTGQIMFVANCDMPRSLGAYLWAQQIFRARSVAQPFSGSFLENTPQSTAAGDCFETGDPCPIEPIYVCPEGYSYNAASDSCLCDNPTSIHCGGGGGGSDDPPPPPNDDPPPPGGGGDGPCLDCDADVVTLVCTERQERGGGVSCSLTSKVSVTTVDWSSATSVGSADEPNSTVLTWAGPGLGGGTVTAVVHTSSAADHIISDSYEIAPRNWNWRNNTSYATAGALPCNNGAYIWLAREQRLPMGMLTGMTCGPQITPDARNQEGYAVENVENGPNKGLWYVKSANFGYYRWSYLINELLPGGVPARDVDDPEDSRCAVSLGASWSGSVDTWDYNAVCERSAGLRDFALGVRDHEHGHYLQGKAEFERWENDLHAILEPLVFASEAELRAKIVSDYQDVNTRIYNASNPSPSSVTGSFWIRVFNVFGFMQPHFTFETIMGH